MIQNGLTVSAKREFLMGVHRPDDVYKIALYSANADLTGMTEVYTPKGEVKAGGYTTGGQILTGYLCDTSGTVAMLTWDDPIWRQATIMARAALIYNETKDGRAIRVIDFGMDVRSTNGPFRIPFDKPSAATAAIVLF